MVLPSLLLILYATRLIGLLLRASTSTAQSVIISFTTRARWASTRGQQPSSFVFPACALREHGSDVRILPLLFWCARWASTGGQQPSSFLFLCAHFGSTGAMCASFLSYSGVRVGRARETNSLHTHYPACGGRRTRGLSNRPTHTFLRMCPNFFFFVLRYLTLPACG